METGLEDTAAGGRETVGGGGGGGGTEGLEARKRLHMCVTVLVSEPCSDLVPCKNNENQTSKNQTKHFGKHTPEQYLDI